MARRLQRTGSRCERPANPRFTTIQRLTVLICAASTLLGGIARGQVVATCTGAPSEVRLQLQITGLHSGAGQVTITVYPDDPKRFLARGGKLLRERVPAQFPVTHACIVVPTPGHYAISVYHDEDGNQKFNRSLIGLPAEGYGFSNNPKSLIGLPDLKDVRIPAAAGDNPFTITLTY